jgi:hypothetical protein
MYQQLLQEHIDDKKSYGESPQPPATATDLEQLRDRAKRELDAELPDAYCELLQVTNGLDSNGLVIYGSRTAPVVGYEKKNLSVEGLVEANLGWRDHPSHKRFVFFAESGSSLYGYDTDKRNYKILDRQSGTEMEDLPSFDELISRALEENHP